MNKKTVIPAPVGGSSLLVIFAVLCLTVFALLELATAKADERLADDGYESIRAYYLADCEAERILGELRAGRMPDGVMREGELFVYTCAVSETQELHVEVALTGEDYEIRQWRIQETMEWQPDDKMDLFDMDMFDTEMFDAEMPDMVILED